MGRGQLGDARPPHGLLHRTLQGLLVRMVPPYYPGTRIDGARPRGKHILPCPLPWRSRVLTRERIGEIDLAITGSQICLVKLPDPAEVVFERGCEGMR